MHTSNGQKWSEYNNVLNVFKKKKGYVVKCIAVLNTGKPLQGLEETEPQPGEKK